MAWSLSSPCPCLSFPVLWKYFSCIFLLTLFLLLKFLWWTSWPIPSSLLIACLYILVVHVCYIWQVVSLMWFISVLTCLDSSSLILMSTFYCFYTVLWNSTCLWTTVYIVMTINVTIRTYLISMCHSLTYYTFMILNILIFLSRSPSLYSLK